MFAKESLNLCCIYNCPSYYLEIAAVRFLFLDQSVRDLSILKKQLLDFSFFKVSAAAAAAKSLQLCPPLCNPIEGIPPGSPVPGTLQARVLEWGAIAFSIL